MDNIRATIDTLFSYINIHEILNILLNPTSVKSEINTLGITKNLFEQGFVANYKHYSLDQVREIYHLLQKEWVSIPQADEDVHYKQKNLFYVLLHYSLRVLVEKDNEPVCQYRQLLRWQMLKYKLGEDLFTTSFLAFRDVRAMNGRQRFDWPVVIGQDNPAINYILQKGVCDVHFHLNVSSLNYELNWMLLMNDIQNRTSEFKKLGKDLEFQSISSETQNQEDAYLSTIQACAIRYYLFLLLKNQDKAETFKSFLWNILRCKRSIDAQSIEQMIKDSDNDVYAGSLQQQIENYKYLYGYKMPWKQSRICPDYAIPDNFRAWRNDGISDCNALLTGERFLMYGIFKRIYGGISAFEETMLFYIYLLQKGRIRRELIQANRVAGFGNFDEYQRRKSVFIEKYPKYRALLPRIAVNMAFAPSNLKYLECRIGPKDSSSELIKDIKWYNQQINRIYTKFGELYCKRLPYYYILHFGKRQDALAESIDKKEISNKGVDRLYLSCRHARLREKIRRQGDAILQAMAHNSEAANSIVGIDAASSELHCRPEVFGPLYRYMKRFGNHLRPKNETNKDVHHSLHFTYHVGEDFWDITDGLRAIDEAILFLNMRGGDRLGHALALGIDAETYYRSRHFKIVMTKQNMLDNVMWLHCKIRQFNIPVSTSLILELEQMFYKFYDGIYSSACGGEEQKNVFAHCRNIKSYYQAWLLRGDDPTYYCSCCEPTQKRNEHFLHRTKWDITKLNTITDGILESRRINEVKLFYREYHYNAMVRRRGHERYEMKVNPEMVILIGAIQKAMLHEVSSKHIAIEANLTSNWFVAGLQRYINHPIIRMNRVGLSEEKSDIHSAQVSVSINTDDRGVFDTSIEAEYALLALALEKELNAQNAPRYDSREIYAWLDNIREMGFEQGFRVKRI